MPRILDTQTLAGAAQHYAASFLRPDRKGVNGSRLVEGPGYVMRELYNAAYLDEHQFLRDAIREELGKNARDRFDALASKHFTPRSEQVFEEELAARLGRTLSGDHREGAIGRVVVGQRYICHVSVEVEAPWSIARRRAMGLPVHVPGRDDRELITKVVPYYWPIYSGEEEERQRPGEGVADPIVLPENYYGMSPPRSVGAASMGISNEAALLACDAVVGRLDEGTGAAVGKGYVAARPADVDTAIGAQTLLFTLTASDPAFAAAVDANPGGRATASAITGDASVDATGTLAFMRWSATNDGVTPIDDHIDGNCGTSGEDYNFNTVSMVAGAAADMTSWTVTHPESP